MRTKRGGLGEVDTTIPHKPYAGDEPDPNGTKAARQATDRKNKADAKLGKKLREAPVLGEMKTIVISAPKFRVLQIPIFGLQPYVSNRMGPLAIEKWKNEQEQTKDQRKQAKAKTKNEGREARDFDAEFHDSMHKTVDGQYGIPTSAFMNAIVSAARILGYAMTVIKKAIEVQPDGYNEQGDPIVFIHGVKNAKDPQPHICIRAVKNKDRSSNLRARGMWDPEWTATITIRIDADMIPDESSVYNLMARAGEQIGVGAGRKDSSSSAGCGWGKFSLSDLHKL